LNGLEIFSRCYLHSLSLSLQPALSLSHTATALSLSHCYCSLRYQRQLLLLLSSISAVAAFAPSPKPTVVPPTQLSESVADLEVLARKLNPVVKFYDPLNLSQAKFWGTSEEETVGFLRHAEIKHGRVAMFAFVGYLAHANGIVFPWAMQMDGTHFPGAGGGGSPPELWDSISDGGRIQILAFIGFLELWSETQGTHYMRGGRPGDFPDFDSSKIPGGALNLYDPFGWNRSMTNDQKETRLLAEINNGRLAMIGIMGFLAEQKVEGSVPLLTGLGLKHYDGDVMMPLSEGHGILHMSGIF